MHAKEENCKNLQIEIDDQSRKVSVIRHQMGLLYEEFGKEKNAWKINKSDFENTIRLIRITSYKNKQIESVTKCEAFTNVIVKYNLLSHNSWQH